MQKQERIPACVQTLLLKEEHHGIHRNLVSKTKKMGNRSQVNIFFHSIEAHPTSIFSYLTQGNSKMESSPAGHTKKGASTLFSVYGTPLKRSA